ncbi:hypothetical protein ACRQ5Q_43415 (plasmid) [Bradyrhizobium sp. PMVTL-01]|uniref:hypothetical protein n=1 Tax=Bradyrhizobium sp. PMVTL-01 TaxID=3434999 RepID=UPI003F71C657
MVRKRAFKAKHEAGHAVVARTLGLDVKCVEARGDGAAIIASAGHAADPNDVAAQIAGIEKDAIIALAGTAANRHDYPEIRVFDVLIDQDDSDTQLACSAIYRMVCLKSGRPVSEGEIDDIDSAMQQQIRDIYSRLLRESAALVEQHWPAIERVAKHLERHGRIDNQAQLDDLIERAERVAALVK